MDHDKLLSGRLPARFDKAAVRHAARALDAALDAALDVADDELEDAMNGYRLLRALRSELLDQGQG